MGKFFRFGRFFLPDNLGIGKTLPLQNRLPSLEAQLEKDEVPTTFAEENACTPQFCLSP